MPAVYLLVPKAQASSNLPAVRASGPQEEIGIMAIEKRHRRAVAADRIVADVLSLPSDERMSLVETLLVSLNLPIQADIEKSWSEESERRVSQIDRGEVTLVPGEKVFERLRKKYRR